MLREQLDAVSRQALIVYTLCGCSGIEPRLMGTLRPAKSPRFSGPGGGFSPGGYRGPAPRFSGRPSYISDKYELINQILIHLLKTHTLSPLSLTEMSKYIAWPSPLSF